MKRRRKTSWYVIWAFIFLASVLSAASFLISLSVWDISKIEVRGAGILSAEYLAKAAEYLKGENLFLADYSVLKKKMGDIAQIKDFAIIRRLPSTVELRVLERKPFAVVNAAGSSAVIDDDGIFLKIDGSTSGKADYSFVSIGDIASLPVVRGISLSGMRDGRLSGDIARFLKVSIGGLSGFLPRDGLQLEIHARDSVDLLVEDVLKVRFGSVDNIAWKIAVLRALLPRIKDEWNNIEYVDIRAVDLPVIKFKKPKST